MSRIFGSSPPVARSDSKQAEAWVQELPAGEARVGAVRDLTIAQVGLAASIYTWAFALCQFFSGSLLDRYGTRPLMSPLMSRTAPRLRRTG